MKRKCLIFLSWILVTTAVISPMRVNGFGFHTDNFKSHATASLMPIGRCGHTCGMYSDTKERMYSSNRASMIDGEGTVTDDDAMRELWWERRLNWGIRSTLASAFALALVASSFVDMASAELAAPSTSTFTTTTIVATSSTDSLSPSTPAVERGGSPAGSAVVYAWVGISGFAGIKGIYDRIQEEEEAEAEDDQEK